LVKKIKKIIKKYNIKFIVDAPCGDCNWINKLFSNSRIKYIGIDIVSNLIKINKKKFSNKNISFHKSNIVKENIPNCDLLISRDFLFHLNYQDIKKFLRIILKSKIRYFLTSNHTLPNNKKFFKNKDIISGDFRKINLFQTPFNFEKNYEEIIRDYCDGEKKYLILFNRKQILKFLENFN
jgi:hypothetical protein